MSILTVTALTAQADLRDKAYSRLCASTSHSTSQEWSMIRSRVGQGAPISGRAFASFSTTPIRNLLPAQSPAQLAMPLASRIRLEPVYCCLAH